MICKTLDCQSIGTVFDHLDDCVVQGILVLLQPPGEVVGDGGGVVDDGKVSVGVGARVGLGELGPLAQHVVHQLLAEGLIRCLGEEGLLLEDGEEGHGLLEHVNALLQIHSKVNVCPIQAFSHVLLLLQRKPAKRKLSTRGTKRRKSKE